MIYAMRNLCGSTAMWNGRSYAMLRYALSGLVTNSVQGARTKSDELISDDIAL